MQHDITVIESDDIIGILILNASFNLSNGELIVVLSETVDPRLKFNTSKIGISNETNSIDFYVTGLSYKLEREAFKPVSVFVS